MSNLLTLTQDEIDRFGIKGKEVGDVITAEEYSKLRIKEEKEDKPEIDTAPTGKKDSSKK